MAQVFISHSRRDSDLVNFFSRVGSTTKVRLVFEEFENITSGQVTAEGIRQHIAESHAVFIVLSPHVQDIPHTRDWVLWEAGVASNKDLWVFETCRDQGCVTVVTPYLRRYVVFEPIDASHSYIHQILESYGDSHVLGTLLITGGLGALLGGGTGALAGAAAGAAFSNRSRIRPVGLQVSCARCLSTYQVHLPQGQQRFRCPACNSVLAAQW